MAQLTYPAFHVLWTKPNHLNGEVFNMDEAELLTMIVSALMWQKYNGTIKLYTDQVGYEFIEEHNLLNLWDAGINTEVLESNAYPIDPGVFWAAGKLLALEAEKSPCVMLDTDLIVMQPINKLLEQTAIMALHPEALESIAYPNPSLLKIPENFIFPNYYNWNVLPSNTAFLYIRDEVFKQFYLDESKRFMFNNTGKSTELVSQMVFAEQRLLSICAEHVGVTIDYLLSDPFSFSNKEIVHLWGFKNILRQNRNIQTIYSRQLFKTVEDQLSTNPAFRKYLEMYPIY